MTTAHLRPFGAEDNSTVLELVEGRSDPWIVQIPGLGYLVVGRHREAIARLGGWTARLFQPPAETGAARDVTVVNDGEVHVELLPNVSGEDRLVVVLELDELPHSQEASDGSTP